MANTSKPLQIFRTGTHTAMSGHALAFSESDLAASAAAYDPALFEAPIVVGHPQLDAPAYGWVKRLAFAGNALEAEPHQVDPAFAEMVGAGRFKKISAAFWSPTAPGNPSPGVFYLRHVGFLGAQAPAVKGLRSPEFAADDAGVVEFSEWDDVTNAGLWRSLREWLIGKFGQDEADKVVPGYQVQSLEQSAQDELKEAAAEVSAVAPAPAFSEPEINPEETSTVTPEEKAALEAENAQLKQRASDAEAAIAALKAAQVAADNAAFADRLIGDGKLLPANKAVVVASMNLFAAESPKFADDEGEKTLLDAFNGFLQSMPKRVEFGEVATGGNAAGVPGSVEYAAPQGFAVDRESVVLHQKALAHQAAHDTDYLTAVKAVSAQS